MTTERAQRERIHFDSVVASHRIEPVDEYAFLMACTYPRLFELMGDIRGKRVCDYGCGDGQLTTLMAKRGADTYGFDVSPRSVALARSRPELAHATLEVMAAESMTYPDNFFDVVVGNAILHHLELRIAIPELVRVLKFGGRAIFVEPLGENPLLRFARNRLPYPNKHRSTDEQPLLYADIELIASHFSTAIVIHYDLVTMVCRFFPTHKTKAVVVIERPIRYVLGKVDYLLLRVIPFLRRYCRMVALVMQR